MYHKMADLVFILFDAIEVLCAYLEGDLTRIRASVFLGSVVPLLTLLIWDAIALGLSNQADQVSDPLELLLRSVTFAYCLRHTATVEWQMKSVLQNAIHIS